VLRAAAAVVGVLVCGLALAASAASASQPYVAVDGNHLVGEEGQTIRLLGVDRSGAEYECLGGQQVFDGPVDEASVAAIASWHVNAVRVPLNEDCWLGINGIAESVGGLEYQSAVEQYVQALQSHGIVVILDLHWAAPGAHVAASQWPMADAEHAPEFWRSVASAFGSNHGVVFDLFNEPYIGSWSCWLEGCETSYDDEGSTVVYESAGMQSLVDAVRSTGADQPIMLGGLGYSSDESEWLAHEPHDPDGQLVVSFHTYNFSGCNDEACWNEQIAPLAERVPVVTGEMGENGCKDSYIDRYMPWADAHGISYLGWTWDSTEAPSYWSCSEGPALIKTYAGKPTPFGAGLKRHLAKLAAAERRHHKRS
jgi:Cellulase (glycosyl hydrolase family 5)